MKYLLLILLTSLTLFASIGKVVAFRGDATIVRDDKQLKVKLGSEIEKNDKITTKANAKMQLIFNDRTIITIGPNSNFKVEEYIYEKRKNRAQFSMKRGTFNTITGKIGKIAPNRFKIKTKSATIGIRGTQFLINASQKNVQVLCTQGAVSVTDNFQNKSVDVPAGFSTEVHQGETPKPPEKITAASLKKVKAKLEPKKSKAKTSTKSDASTKSDNGTSGKKSTKEESSKKDNSDATDEGAKKDDGTDSTQKDDNTADKQTSDEGNTQDATQDNTEGADSSKQAPVREESFTAQTSAPSKVVVKIKDNFIVDIPTQKIPSTIEITQVLSSVETIAQDVEIKQVSDKIIEKKENLVTKIPDNAKIPETSIGTIHKNDTKLSIDENLYLSWGYWVDSSDKKVDTYLDGIATSESIIQDHISNNFSASYSGDVIGLENSSRTVDGNFKMSVDFGQNRVGVDEFHINNGTQNWDVTSSDSTKNMNDAGQFNVNVSNTNNVNGVMKGQFYGSKAEAIGGTANLKAGSNTLDATFSGVR